MIILFLVWLFVFGLFIGSFLGVVSDRVPNNKSIVFPSSHCDFCKKKLKWYDNIPLLSFVLLSGKCRFCNKKLSLFYPIIELVTGLMFVLISVQLNLSSIIYHLSSGNIIELLFYLFITSSLIAIFFADLKYEIIPSVVLYPAVAISFLYILLNTQYLIQNSLLSALSAFLFFLVLFFVTRRRGMGLGDVQLAFFMGLLLGFPKIVVALYIAFLTGGIVSFILILWGKKKLHGSTIPFGPFLVFGTFASLFYGNLLLHFLGF